MARRSSGYVRFLGDDIEMDDEFVGKAQSLPACPQTRADGWCRDGKTGQAMRAAVHVGAAPMTTNTKLALAAGSILALFVLLKT